MTNLIITYIGGLIIGFIIGWHRLWQKNDEPKIYYIEGEHWTPELEALSRQQEVGSFRNDMGYEVQADKIADLFDVPVEMIELKEKNE